MDDLNPVLNFTRKEVESLLHFVEEEPDQKYSLKPHEDMEMVMSQACLRYPHLITKVPARCCCCCSCMDPLRNNTIPGHCLFECWKQNYMELFLMQIRIISWWVIYVVNTYLLVCVCRSVMHLIYSSRNH